MGNTGILLVGLLLTMFAYLIFPLCYRFANGKVYEKKGKKLALWNSIICEAIFTIGGLLMGLGASTSGTMFAQGFLYYFITKRILIDYRLKPTPTPKPTQKNGTEKVTICKQCGMQMFSDEEKCSNCKADNPIYIKDKTNHPKQNLEDVPDENSVDKINKVNINKIALIKKLQIVLVSSVCVFLLFVIVYPITVNSIYTNKIPSTNNYQTIQLTKLDANQKVYCEMNGNYNYLYVKETDGFTIYRFYNATMYYSNSYVRSGYATSSQLKSYFNSNIYSGIPPASSLMPAFIPIIGVCLSIAIFIAIIAIGILIHRYSEEEIFHLTKSEEPFIKLKNDFKNENISKYDYKKMIKNIFSSEILKNNKFFEIFKFLY